ncbi:MAG: PH domain-containing protein [Clostridia bacterium]|nr:PH domain-containing protein [Clostridia bacterium]
MEFKWQDRKRIFFGLPWSFTRYFLTEDKLIVDTGFFSRKEDEVRLYRIMDITLKRSLWERLFGLGTIHCCTGDKTSPELDILHIKDAKRVKEMLSEMVETERKERMVATREFMDGEMMDDDHIE